MIKIPEGDPSLSITELDRPGSISHQKSWPCSLMAAKGNGTTVSFYFDTATASNPTSCAGIQAWGTYFPYFLFTLD